MKKLEDIPKKEIFTTPEGYFDALPGKIQARISAKPEKQPFFAYTLKYALPVIALLAAGIFWYTANQETTPADAESILASVETEALIAYLDESEISTEDLIENLEFRTDDIEAIESEIYILPLEELDLDGEQEFDTLEF
jgi:hypothetical protein